MIQVSKGETAVSHRDDPHPRRFYSSYLFPAEMYRYLVSSYSHPFHETDGCRDAGFFMKKELIRKGPAHMLSRFFRECLLTESLPDRIIMIPRGSGTRSCPLRMCHNRVRRAGACRYRSGAGQEVHRFRSGFSMIRPPDQIQP